MATIAETFGLRAATDLGQLAVLLKNNFLNAANWRREKAVEFPNDARNLRAVAELERLAKSVDVIEPEVMQKYAAAVSNDDALRDVCETENEMLREVGFHSEWRTAHEFIGSLLERAQRP